MAKKKSIKELLSEAPREIADGITVEKLSPMFFDSSRLKIQPEPIYRMDSANHRYYYRFENNEPVFYTSVTTLIRATLPTSPHLIKWLIDKGGDAGKDEAEERAHYGTFLHGECAKLLINGKYDLDNLSNSLLDYLVSHNLPKEKVSWADELKKDVLAFAQFMIDCNVKPLAIEIILYHPTDGYAGAIDLVCELDIEEKGFFGEVYASGANKGQPKETKQTRRVMAILDIKSGRKGFYESHEIQLQAYKEMWNIHFPSKEGFIDNIKLFNWSPKEYRGVVPSYNLKDQTNSKNIAKLPYLVALSKIEADKRSDTITVLKGMVNLTEGLTSNISEMTFAELVKKEKL